MNPVMCVWDQMVYNFLVFRRGSMKRKIIIFGLLVILICSVSTAVYAAVRRGGTTFECASWLMRIIGPWNAPNAMMTATSAAPTNEPQLSSMPRGAPTRTNTRQESAKEIRW